MRSIAGATWENFSQWSSGGLRRSRYLRVERTHAATQYFISAGNLLRMARLKTDPPVATRA